MLFGRKKPVPLIYVMVQPGNYKLLFILIMPWAQVISEAGTCYESRESHGRKETDQTIISSASLYQNRE